MENRDFKGVWIPKEIWLSTELSMIEKGILTEISSLDNENHCIASNEYLAEFCQCSVPTVSRAIKHLLSLNYIEIVSFDGRKRIIKMNMLPNQNDKADQSKRLTNNIYNNKNNNTISKDMVYTSPEQVEFTFGNSETGVQTCALPISTLVKVQKESGEHDYLDIIQNSIDHAWKTFYPIKDFEYSKKPQSKKFEENMIAKPKVIRSEDELNLAKDENGNNIVY